MIKIDFQFETPYGKYADALYLPEDHSYTNEQIKEMQSERLNKWVNNIENPPAPEPEIVEVDGVQYEKIKFDGQVLLKPLAT